ncbi:hypothetical protein N825_27035 [Skermanella stibiiresistens SB22]|uniref:Uncharacterized protein n=1 Tax=Skermanella stibiiresistens SB22 TaxID=1385369 RepID=W9GY45_9PROT|nr:tape measure protein [Skermanella stibiiresistens]EWY36403.1 hypothetical protein N825_27035 [Skermanella stibiiresistens SB22]
MRRVPMAIEREAHLQILIDGSKAEASAKRLKDALEGVRAKAEQVHKVMNAVGGQRIDLKVSTDQLSQANRSIQALQRQMERTKPIDLTSRGGDTLARMRADLGGIQRQIGMINATRISPRQDPIRPVTPQVSPRPIMPTPSVSPINPVIPSVTPRAPDLSGVTRAVGGLSDGFKRLESAVLSVQGVLAGLGAGLVVRDIAQTGMAFESLEKGLEVATDSAIQGRAEFARLKAETDRLGLSTLDAGKDYVNFLASVTGSSVNVESAKNTFFGVAQAMALLGKSPADASRAFTALSQMASKGKITAEELTGQLAEQLPGAFALTAKALGMSTAELSKAMEKGQVAIQDFFNAFDGAVRAKFPVDRMASASAEFRRFNNAMDEAKRIIADGGFLKGAADGAQELARWLNSVEGRKLATELGGALKSAVDSLIEGFRFLSQHTEGVKTAIQALIAVKIGSWILGIVSAVGGLIGSFGRLGSVLVGHPLLAIPAILGTAVTALVILNGKVQDGTAAWAEHADKMRSIQGLHDQLRGAQGQEREAIQAKIKAVQEEARETVKAIQEQIDKRKELIAWENKLNPGSGTMGPLTNQDEQYGVAPGQDLDARLKSAQERETAAGNVLAGKSPEGVRTRGRPTAGTGRGAATVQPEKAKPTTPATGENVAKRFAEQRDEIKARISAEGELSSAYDMGTDAVEQQTRAMEILNRVQGLNPKYTKAQVAELENLIGALYDAQQAMRFQEAAAGMVESIDQTNRLTDATMRMADSVKQDGTALWEKQAAIEARNAAIQLGISHDKARVDSLTELFRAQKQANEDKGSAEAINQINQGIAATELMTDALKLEGAERTAAMARIQEESRLLAENADLTTELSRRRIDAAATKALAENDNRSQEDIEDLRAQINAASQYQSALGLTGEALIRKNAEIEKTIQLERDGISATNDYGQQQIRLAGQLAVATDRLQRQQDALMDLANSGMTFNEQMRAISYGGLLSMEDALVGIIDGTKGVKEAFADMARSVAADLARMAIRQAITIPLAGLIGGAFGGAAGIGTASAANIGAGVGQAGSIALAGVHHAGGIAGRDAAPFRQLPMTTFMAPSIPRYHTGGIAGAEVPAILKRGEGVFTEGQMKALSPAGGSGPAITNTVSVNMPQGASQEDGARFGKAITRQLEGMVQEQLRRAARPGGMYNPNGMR